VHEFVNPKTSQDRCVTLSEAFDEHYAQIRLSPTPNLKNFRKANFYGLDKAVRP
jgi:hypothetical protein